MSVDDEPLHAAEEIRACLRPGDELARLTRFRLYVVRVEISERRRDFPHGDARQNLRFHRFVRAEQNRVRAQRHRREERRAKERISRLFENTDELDVSPAGPSVLLGHDQRGPPELPADALPHLGIPAAVGLHRRAHAGRRRALARKRRALLRSSSCSSVNAKSIAPLHLAPRVEHALFRSGMVPRQRARA